ncbi:2-keto-3-deoxygluconate permease [Coriobacterium glomerans]|nr:2-keto-3-deoxygluconate permease [Coriobacterium glomerans]
MEKVPGGQIIVPLVAAMLINTIFPGALGVGGPATALLRKGGQTLMGLFLIICGSQINIRQAGLPLYKGALLLGMKLGFGAALGWGVNAAFGSAGVLGLSPFVLFCAIPSNNSSLYIALSGEYGDATDVGAVSVLALKNGPMGSMVIMGLSGAAQFSMGDLIGTAIPVLIGIVWGNCDREFRCLCLRSEPVIMIFLSFAIGATSNLGVLFTAGASGIALAVLAIGVGIAIQIVYNVLLKKKTPLGVAMGTVAANSALTPSIIASADRAFEGAVPVAAAQCATASIITMILMPFIVSFFDHHLH